MVMASLTGLVSLTGCTEALPDALPPLAAPELSVEVDGVLGELLHPSTRPSTRRAITHNNRVAFTETPSLTLLCHQND
jgi:hypothetical protein